MGLACDAWGMQAFWLTIGLGGIGCTALLLVDAAPRRHRVAV